MGQNGGSVSMDSVHVVPPLDYCAICIDIWNHASSRLHFYFAHSVINIFVVGCLEGKRQGRILQKKPVLSFAFGSHLHSTVISILENIKTISLKRIWNTHIGCFLIMCLSLAMCRKYLKNKTWCVYRSLKKGIVWPIEYACPDPISYSKMVPLNTGAQITFTYYCTRVSWKYVASRSVSGTDKRQKYDFHTKHDKRLISQYESDYCENILRVKTEFEHYFEWKMCFLSSLPFALNGLF